jgi:radical SAM superfamily enzyme YgiQ (UPF0313 family)
MRFLFIDSFLGSNFGTDILGIAYLSACLKSQGHEVDAVDIRSHKAIVSFAKQFRPDYLLFSTTTGTHHIRLEINKKIKEEIDTYSVFGGPHATYFPEMIEDEGVDAICIGEGDEALIDFVRRKENGECFTDTPNFWVKHNGNIYKNSARPLIADLDEIPFADREITKKFSLIRDFKIKNFLSTRGCPYKCTFCSNNALHELYKGKGKIVRHRSVDNLIAEIKEVQREFDLKMVWFRDDVFGVSRDWLAEFSGKYKQEIGLPFRCVLQPKMVTRDRVKYLKDAGLASTSIGVESGDDDVRNKIFNRGIKREELINTAELLHEFDIPFGTFNILGVPFSNFESNHKTLELNLEMKPAWASTTIYQPLPRTVLGDKVLNAGLFGGYHDKVGASSDNDKKSVLNKNKAMVVGQSQVALERKKEVENFKNLFPIIVEYPHLAPMTKFLIKLPLGKFYIILDQLFRGYIGMVKFFGYKRSFKETLILICRYMQSGFET